MPRKPAPNGHRRPEVTEPAPAGAPAGVPDEDLGALLRQLATHVRELFAKGSAYASLGVKRFKLRAVDGAFGVVWAIAAFLAVGTIVISAALLVVNGLRHAIARWSGLDWVGELVGGLLALALPFVALLVVQRRTRRKLLERALDAPATPPEKANPTPSDSTTRPTATAAATADTP